ncbi:uncharacterized protein LOC134203283 [Armigeres subalbatus]|uniref:uncharacterized protein LOC134203283 n=1 Tax=Armigeres subalbatus TaxID=124917 RepID=UPI002ED3A509
MAVRYSIGYTTSIQRTEEEAWPSPRMWKTSYFDDEVFKEAFRREHNTLGLSGEQLVTVLSRACDATMPRKVHPRNGRPPAYWWTQVGGGCSEHAQKRSVLNDGWRSWLLEPL